MFNYVTLQKYCFFFLGLSSYEDLAIRGVNYSLRPKGY